MRSFSGLGLSPMRRRTAERDLRMRIYETFRRSAAPNPLRGRFHPQRGSQADRETNGEKTGLITARQRVFSRSLVSLDPPDSAPQPLHPPKRLSQMLKELVAATRLDCLPHQPTHHKEVHRRRNHTRAIPFIHRCPLGGFLATRRRPHVDKRCRATEPRLTNRRR